MSYYKIIIIKISCYAMLLFYQPWHAAIFTSFLKCFSNFSDLSKVIFPFSWALNYSWLKSLKKTS